MSCKPRTWKERQTFVKSREDLEGKMGPWRTAASTDGCCVVSKWLAVGGIEFERRGGKVKG